MKLVRFGLYLLAALVVLFRPPLAENLWQELGQTLPQNVHKQLGSAAAKSLRGVDLSHYDGAVDFKQLQAAGIDFVFLKATQGTGYVDPTYQSHITAVKATSLLHGAYHFFEPKSDPESQANHFISQVKNSGNTLPPVLDIEITQDQSADAIKAGVKVWLELVEEALGCKPMLYSYGDFWQENLGAEFNDYAFWLADYASQPTVPKGLENWRLWQYSDKGQVPGVEHSVDMNVTVSGELQCYA